MTPARWDKIEQLFEAALAEPDERRDSFLQGACRDDDALRLEVSALLSADSKSDGQFEEMAFEVAADWAANDDHDGLIGNSIGRYGVIKLLSAGGMGRVYLAEDHTLNRKVALKFLPRYFTQHADRLRRFEQEARAASGLNHPNIITVYEIGEADGGRFIATEFVEGRTLQQRPDPLPFDKILQIGIEAAGALAAAHEAGIVHRDIKPANIMLRHDGYIKVLDFGLAKLTGARAHLDVTQPGRVMGTINYMSPEQALGQPLDHRTDIFSLGVVLYELVTGQRLFGGESEAAVYDSILHQEPPPMREFAPATPPEFEQVVRRALAKKPQDRYQTTAALRTDLQRLARGSEITEAARAVVEEKRAARRSQLLRVGVIALFVLGTLTALFFTGRWARETVPVSANSASRPSVAVLPFQDLSGAPEKTYFSEAVHDQVLTALGKISDLKVIGRASVMPYTAGAPRNLREIGQQLGANYILEASLQRGDDKVRVNAQLSDTGNEVQLWAESFDLRMSDVLTIQNQIATTITQQLRAHLTTAERKEIEQRPTSDLTALECESRGRSLLDLADSQTENSQENAFAAIDALNQAVQRDPNFLQGYRQLERGHDFIYASGMDHSPSRLGLGQAAIDAMLRISPNSSITHLALANHLFTQREYARAEEVLNAARTTSPNDPEVFMLRGYIDRRLGKWEDSTRAMLKALDLDPRNPMILKHLSSNYHALGNFPAYAGVMERLIAVAPEPLAPRLARASADFLWFGNIGPLHAEVDDALIRDPTNVRAVAKSRLQVAIYERDLPGIAKALSTLGDEWFGSDNEKFSPAFMHGLLARMQGDSAGAKTYFTRAREEQEKLVQAQPNYAPAISMLGLIDAILGRKEEALAEGRRAVELLPTVKDSLGGPAMAAHLAIIAGWVGEKSLAIEQLRAVIHRAGGPQYGTLKLDPLWDPLRGDARFTAILEGLQATSIADIPGPNR